MVWRLVHGMKDFFLMEQTWLHLNDVGKELYRGRSQIYKSKDIIKRRKFLRLHEDHTIYSKVEGLVRDNRSNATCRKVEKMVAERGMYWFDDRKLSELLSGGSFQMRGTMQNNLSRVRGEVESFYVYRYKRETRVIVGLLEIETMALKFHQLPWCCDSLQSH